MKMMMTNELPAEIMENGIHYTLVGDYYFPTCMLADRSPNGKWASLYERYLQEKHPHEYVRLIWADELAALLHRYFGDGIEIETGTVTKDAPRFEFFK